MIERRRPVKQEYRYQFVRLEAAVFRYDNAPHHKHITTHPHHKHVGAKILRALEPEFGHMLDEGVALLSEETRRIERGTKKRRHRKSKKS